MMSRETTPKAPLPTGNVTITVEVTLLDELRKSARRNRRSISAQAAVFIDTGLEMEQHDRLNQERADEAGQL